MFGKRRRGNTVEAAAARPGTTLAWSRVIVLANRAPLKHDLSPDDRITVTRSASGLVTALEPLIEAHSGTWVAHGSGDADTRVVDARGGLDVPPANPRYRIRYVALPPDEHRGHYYGFSNEGLWPLCHDAGVAPVFRPHDFQMYAAATRRFTAAVAEEAAPRSLVLVQDYHFALAPRLLRQSLPSSTVVAFWHVPWPRPHVFRACPWARELLDGMLGADIVGLQTRDDCLNFLACVEALLDGPVDVTADGVTYRGHATTVRAYPVGVDATNPVRSVPGIAACREQVCRDLKLPADVRLGVGIDRLDYTKGIPEKFLAVERLLERRPDLRGRFVFLQVAEPSRDCLPEYQAERARIADVGGRVNARFATRGYQPIRVIEAHHELPEVYRFYRAAELCLVGSLSDGMNLVAKEFVSARDDERGVLVLSECTGAAQQLRAAVLFNPRDVHQAAEALAFSLDMPAAEQAIRMRLLRANVRAFSASWWADQLVHDAGRETGRHTTAASLEDLVAERLSA